MGFYQLEKMPAAKTKKRSVTLKILHKKEPSNKSRENLESGLLRLPDSKLSGPELEKRNRRRARNREAAARQRDKRIAQIEGLEKEKIEIEESNQNLKIQNDNLKNEIVKLKEALENELLGDVSQPIQQVSPILVGLIPSPIYAIATSTASEPYFHFPIKSEESSNGNVFNLF